MRKWLFFAGSALLAIFAFVDYVFVASCNGTMPTQPIPSATIKGCFPFLETSFYLFVVAAASLFLAYLIINDSEDQRKNKS